ncbi:MAG TPA: outer membrane beta-barrel protein [Flavisolibacter sp.]|nr:outer membrane beta-barrel protein [Flavisolibacter sp.]
MRNYCAAILFSITFFLQVDLYGQAVRRLSGQVMAENGDPLAGASVSLLNKDSSQVRHVLTDSNGRFALSHDRNGSYFLLVSHTGYHSYKSVAFDLDDTDLGAIRLVALTKGLKEVTVRSDKALIALEDNNIVYNVARSIDAQGGNALDALRKAPGVMVGSDNIISLNGKQGVLVLLDGKQTYLSGQELSDLLRSMPASGIRSIEIIANPTAKYDAAGSAGIINIRTLKSQIKGLTGTATTGISYGITPKHNQDLSFTYRKNRWITYGSYNHFIGNYTYDYGSDRIQSQKFYNSATDDTDKRKRLNSRLGADYLLNKNNTLGILVNANFIFGGGITRTTTGIGPAATGITEKLLTAANDYYFQQTDRYNINLNYKYEDASGRMLNADVDYGHFNKSNRNLQSNVYTDAQAQVISSNLYRSLNDIAINMKAFKLDYTAPAWKGTLEAGSKYAVVSSQNNASFYHVLTTKDSLDNRRSNRFGFDERISSVYINYKKSIGKWSLQAGLRLEHTSSEGSLLFKDGGRDTVQTTPRNYLDLFPSVSIAVKPATDHSLLLSYSRRIDRPAYQDLNPFVYLLDELSFWQGNPFLQPQLSHRASIQYVYKSKTIISLGFAHTDRFSTRITDTVELVKIVMIPRNLGSQKNLSLTVTQNVLLSKWWELSFNGVLYQNRNRIAFDAFRNRNIRQLAGRLSLQQRFKLPFDLAAEVSAFVNTKRLSGANEISRGTSQVDLGLQKTFLKGKGILRLALNDLYKGSKLNSMQDIQGLYLESYSYYETRQIRLNFTYKFADSPVKGARSRSSALENENGRIR